MDRRYRKGVASAVLLAALALAWVEFAPVQIGGSTLYSATVGTSMEPLFHKGDLAIVRRGSSYKVGDVVLYESPVLHRPVLHRILVIQNGRYYFKGDNNGFVDPGYARPGDLLGKLWFHVPRAGHALGWLESPLHTALLAAAAVALLLLGGGARTGRRRGRRRRHAAGGKAPAPPMTASVKGFSRRHLHRPRKSAENVLGGIALALAVVLCSVGFGTSTTRTVSERGFVQKGTFSYTARALRGKSTYPTGVARTGQPLFLNDVGNLTVGFAYRFSSRLDHRVRETVTLKALVASATGWRTLHTLGPARSFTGDAATVSGTLDLHQLRALTDQISRESDSVGSEYTIDLQATVHVTGVVRGERIDSTFSPVLPFTLSPSLLKLDIAAPVAPPGATYEAPSAAATLAAGLNPTRIGTVPGLGPNYLSIARYHFSVPAVRGAGLGLAGLALLALLSKLLKPRREVWSNERRIAHRYGCVVVDIVSLAGGPGTRPSTDVPTFESLAVLAQYCERPILRETSGQQPAYGVEDDGRLYIYRPGTAPSVSRLAAAEAS